jgi:hypothetical protein
VAAWSFGAGSLARNKMITTRQIKAARVLLAWTTVVATLEAAGVIFIEANGEGPGVRLRKTK